MTDPKQPPGLRCVGIGGQTQRTVATRPGWPRLAMLLGCAWLLASCATSPDDLTGEITPAEYFQHAQEATAASDFGGAMAWYEAFRERYGTDPTRGVQNLLLWAEYEVAFLHHKMGDDRTAVRLLGELIDRYEAPEAATYAPAPRILALRVIEELQPGAAADAAGAG